MSDEKQPSEWALKQAMELCPARLHVPRGAHSTICSICTRNAVALDDAVERGRRLERWDCWDDVKSISADAARELSAAYPGPFVKHHCAQECADAINNRGPMLEDEQP